ncbi:hypothetical protein BgiMline_028983 [Biomphalaria glabrata]|nr:hypothetical protein BgiMline_025613 [Biomphalaria glabrata]
MSHTVIKEKDTIDLKRIPNSFNFGNCYLQIDDEACPREDKPIRYPDAWIFLKKKLEQENLKPDLVLIPKSWQLNLLTRVYVEMNKLDEAEAINRKVLKLTQRQCIVAVANSVVLQRLSGKNKDARDLANELNEQFSNMTQMFKSQLIDAISEQAYYHYMLSRDNALTGSVILDFVSHLRKGALLEHENYLMFTFYRRLTHSNNESDKVEDIVGKILQLLRDIETNTESDELKAIVYLEMERILNDNPEIQIQFLSEGEQRTQEEFLELAKQFGNNSALALLEIGINRMKRDRLEDGKTFIERSYSIQPCQRSCKILEKVCLNEVQALANPEDEKIMDVHKPNTLRQYLRNYAAYLDWTQNDQIKVKLDQCCIYSRKGFDLLKTKSLSSLLSLAKILVKCRQYGEACALIDEHYLINPNGGGNLLLEVHINVLRAIVEEAQHEGLIVSEKSKECIKRAVKLAYSESDSNMKFITEDDLLNRLQKIPSLKILRVQTLNGTTLDEKIQDFLKQFAPFIECKNQREYNPEFLEILCVKNAIFMIEEKRYREANAECDKIINHTVKNNIFSTIRALILKAKICILEIPTTRSSVKTSLRWIQKAYNLHYQLDENKTVSNKRLLQYLHKFPLNYSYFFQNELH